MISYSCPDYAHVCTCLEWRPFPGKSISTYFIRPCLNLSVGEIQKKAGDRTPHSDA